MHACLLLTMRCFSCIPLLLPGFSALDLSNWMKETRDAIRDLTPLDLVLAGTHDTLTYDLGNYIAESEMPWKSIPLCALYEYDAEVLTS